MVNYIVIIATIIQPFLIKERYATKTASITATLEQLQPTPSASVVSESLAILKASSQVPSLYTESIFDLLQSTPMQQKSVSVIIPVSKTVQDSSHASPVVSSRQVKASRSQFAQKLPVTFYSQSTLERQSSSVLHSLYALPVLSSLVSHAPSGTVQRQVSSSNIQAAKLSQSVSEQKESVIPQAPSNIAQTPSIMAHSPLVIAPSSSIIAPSSSIIAQSLAVIIPSSSLYDQPTSVIYEQSPVIAEGGTTSRAFFEVTNVYI